MVKNMLEAIMLVSPYLILSQKTTVFDLCLFIIYLLLFLICDIYIFFHYFIFTKPLYSVYILLGNVNILFSFVYRFKYVSLYSPIIRNIGFVVFTFYFYFQ